MNKKSHGADIDVFGNGAAQSLQTCHSRLEISRERRTLAVTMGKSGREDGKGRFTVHRDVYGRWNCRFFFYVKVTWLGHSRYNKCDDVEADRIHASGPVPSLAPSHNVVL